MASAHDSSAADAVPAANFHAAMLQQTVFQSALPLSFGYPASRAVDVSPQSFTVQTPPRVWPQAPVVSTVMSPCHSKSRDSLSLATPPAAFFQSQAAAAVASGGNDASARSAAAPACEFSSWRERLCHTSFFGQCEAHLSSKYRRCEHTFFCLDCNTTRGLCSLCQGEHSSCRLLQVRRYVYRDVIKVGDIEPFYDPSGIQSYTVNHAQAVFLSCKDKAPSAPYKRMDSSARCAQCERGLRAGCQYCSLACKLAVTEGIPLPAIPDHAHVPHPRRRQQQRAAAAAAATATAYDTNSELRGGGNSPTACGPEFDRADTLDSAESNGSAAPSALAAVQRVPRLPRASAAAATLRARRADDAPPAAAAAAVRRKRSRSENDAAVPAPPQPPEAAAPPGAGRSRRKQCRPARASE